MFFLSPHPPHFSKAESMQSRRQSGDENEKTRKNLSDKTRNEHCVFSASQEFWVIDKQVQIYFTKTSDKMNDSPPGCSSSETEIIDSNADTTPNTSVLR